MGGIILLCSSCSEEVTGKKFCPNCGTKVEISEKKQNTDADFPLNIQCKTCSYRSESLSDYYLKNPKKRGKLIWANSRRKNWYDDLLHKCHRCNQYGIEPWDTEDTSSISDLLKKE